jgi:hypothetical protein
MKHSLSRGSAFSRTYHFNLLRALPMTTRSAVISPNRKYRYHLFRKVARGRGPVATFIMLNPSTADHELDDPTIRKCAGFCKRWGCAELHVANLFALRATNPAELRTAHDPVGPENWIYVRQAVQNATHRRIRGPVVCAWGTHGGFIGQDQAVLTLLAHLCKPICLGFTRDGYPRHPLYVPYSAILAPFG